MRRRKRSDLLRVPRRARRALGTVLTIVAVGLSLAALSAAIISGQVDPGYHVGWWTVDGGGGAAVSTTMPRRLVGTLGQADAGFLTGDITSGLTVQGGFWNRSIIVVPPAAPVDVRCEARCDKANPMGGWTLYVSWSALDPDATDAHVYRSVDGRPAAEIVTVWATTTAYVDRNVSVGHVYTYFVRAHRHRDDAYSPPSAPTTCQVTSGEDVPCPRPTVTRPSGGTPTPTAVIVAPVDAGAPSALSCAARSSAERWSVQLAWQDGAIDESDMHIERRIGAATWLDLVALAADGTATFTDGTVLAERKIEYRMRAHWHRSDAYSAYSNAAACLTSPCTPRTCPDIETVVPRDVITATLTDPTVAAGFCDLVNPSLPYHPIFNVRKEWLTLSNVRVPYHPSYNTLIFSAGCN